MNRRRLTTTKKRIHLAAIPPLFRPPLRVLCRRILTRYPDTAALVVIGSVALGSWEEDSDVDLVWVASGRRRKRWEEELDYHYDGVVELVLLNRSSLKAHVAERSSMAHAIAHGVALYDPHGLIRRIQETPLGPPTRQWMDKWFAFFCRRLEYGLESYRWEKSRHRRFCKGKCLCRVSEVLTRAVVNLARVLLATAGVVPNSKAETNREYPKMIHSPRLRRAMEIALNAHHEKRDLSLPEAAELARLGRWLRSQLVRILGKPGTANAPPRR